MSYTTASKIAELVEALPLVARQDVAEYLLKLSPDLASGLASEAYVDLHNAVISAAEIFDVQMADYDAKVENATWEASDRLADVETRLEKLQRALDADADSYDLCTMSLDDVANARLAMETVSKNIPSFNGTLAAIEKIKEGL